MSAFSPTFPKPLGGQVIVWEGAFSSIEVDRIVAMGDAVARQRAQLAHIEDPHGVKRVADIAWLMPSAETGWLYARLQQVAQQLNGQYYHYDLYGEFREALQYTVYDTAQGSHFHWHVDHGAARLDPRKISISLQLSASSDYQDCDLEFQFGDDVVKAPRTRGTIIAFASYVLHRVSPITAGTRKSLVAWVSGPEFR